MFTGIIKSVSKVKDIRQDKGSLFVSIVRPKGWDIREGASISINGVCSTVRFLTSDFFEVEYMPETIKKTTVSNYQTDTLVNLEPSLALKDLLDGHIVQSHVDTRGKIVEIKHIKESVILKIQLSKKFLKYIAAKGSVTVDGISLTVVDAGADWFTVSLVSYTLEHTNLGQAKPNQEVNVETDILAKYLEKLLISQK
jgi:riboflavin synthase